MQWFGGSLEELKSLKSEPRCPTDTGNKEVLKAIWGLLLASGAAFSWVSPGAVHPLGNGLVPGTLGSQCFELASGALHVSGAQGAIPRLGLKPLLGNHAPAFDLVSPHV